MSNKRYHYVYLVFCLVDNSYYFGKRSTSTKPELDTGYLGSGSLQQEKLKLYGSKSFVKIILSEFRTSLEAEEYEGRLIVSGVVKNPISNNLTGGLGSGVGYSDKKWRERIDKQINDLIEKSAQRAVRDKIYLLKGRLEFEKNNVKEIKDNLGGMVRGSIAAKELDCTHNQLRNKLDAIGYNADSYYEVPYCIIEALKGKESQNQAHKNNEFSVSSAAQILGVTERAVQLRCKENQVPKYKGQYIIEEKLIDQWQKNLYFDEREEKKEYSDKYIAELKAHNDTIKKLNQVQKELHELKQRVNTHASNHPIFNWLFNTKGEIQ